MAVLQDRCPPSPLSEIDEMIKKDTGKSREVFCECSRSLLLCTLRSSRLITCFSSRRSSVSDWDPNPIGVASIAQVHLATDRETGKRVAVKLQHPGLEEWSSVDLATVNFSVKLIDYLFPTFSFGWLATEVNESLPLELDFREYQEREWEQREGVGTRAGLTCFRLHRSRLRRNRGQERCEDDSRL